VTGPLKNTAAGLVLVDGKPRSRKAEELRSPNASWESVCLSHVVVLLCRSNLTVLSEVAVLKLLCHLVLLLSNFARAVPAPRSDASQLILLQ